MKRVQLVVVGGGIAGCSAALEAVRQGLEVMLVDEHPQTVASMSLDAPYFYGARLAPVLADASAVADQVLGANELLLECLEAGVDVLTGTCVWANYVPGPNNRSTAERRLGLADAERSWLVAYEHLILAPGARDLVLSFPGWQLPGVLGAAGAAALLTRYRALGGSRALVLGSGNTGLQLAQALIDAGIEVAGIAEVAPAVRGDEALATRLIEAGVPLFLSTVIEAATGDQQVSGVRLRAVDELRQPRTSPAQTIDCDTVCMAFGLAPNIELAAQSGCRLEFSAARGGWVPAIDGDMRTSVPFVYVVGDGAGICEAMLLSADRAAEQGRRAARAIARGDARAGAAEETSYGGESEAPLTIAAVEWLQALVATGGLDVVVCQCEEATRRDILETRAPKYVSAEALRRCGTLKPSARMNQDLVKRLTRVGMGHCQGKRCRDQAAMLLAGASGVDLGQVVPASYRPPVRPLALKVVAARDETQEMRRDWPTWFQPINEGEIG